MRYFENDELEVIVNNAAERFCELMNCTLNNIKVVAPGSGNDVSMTVILGPTCIKSEGYYAFNIDMTMHGEHLTAPTNMAVVVGENEMNVYGVDAPRMKDLIIKEMDGKCILTIETLVKQYPIISHNYCPRTNKFVGDDEDMGGFYRQ